MSLWLRLSGKFTPRDAPHQVIPAYAKEISMLIVSGTDLALCILRGGSSPLTKATSKFFANSDFSISARGEPDHDPKAARKSARTDAGLRRAAAGARRLCMRHDYRAEQR